MIKIDEETIEFAALGGALLGGGGGGSMDEGRLLGEMAMKAGYPTIVGIDELPDDATIVTVSVVGAPASSGPAPKPMDYVRAIEILEQRGFHVDGMITSENGGLASLNGWFQSAVLGIPVVDAPANGRAHPLGVMGSMGLHALNGYLSSQAAVGGAGPSRLEILVSGGMETAARLIRQGAIFSGGMVAVARNPIDLRYIRKNAAVGALNQAVELGRVMSESSSMEELTYKLLRQFSGAKVEQGVVETVALETAGGFDKGVIRVRTDKSLLDLAFWNEYMCIEKEGKRVATFPDLITTVGSESRLPLTTAAIKKGQTLTVVTIPRKHLRLGAGMRDPELFREIEKTIAKEIIRYL